MLKCWSVERRSSFFPPSCEILCQWVATYFVFYERNILPLAPAGVLIMIHQSLDPYLSLVSNKVLLRQCYPDSPLPLYFLNQTILACYVSRLRHST